MCASSVVSDYYMNTYPNRNPNFYGGLPGSVSGSGMQQPVVHTLDAETKDLLRQALRLLDRIDKKLGDVECMDATKAAFLKSLDLDLNNPR